MTKDDYLIFESYNPRYKVGDIICTHSSLHTDRINRDYDLGNIITTIIKTNEHGDYGVNLKGDLYYLDNCNIDHNKTKEIQAKFKPEDRGTAVDLLDI